MFVNVVLACCYFFIVLAAPQVVKGPVTKHFPLNCKRVGFSFSSEKRVTLQQYVHQLGDDIPAVFVVGAFAHGQIDAPYVDELVSVSEYPLSAAYCLCRITNAFEQKWGVV